MFEQKPQTTKLILVHSKNTLVFANYLQMLVSSNNDTENSIVGIKDGSVETTIWNEKIYLDQKPTMSSLDHIVFIGWAKSLSEESYGMINKYDYLGMQYGWLGKRAYLKVSDYKIKSKELQDFFDLVKKYNPEAERDIAKYYHIVMKYATQAVLPVPFSVAGEVKDYFRSIQYKTLTQIFYKEGLAMFLSRKE